MMPVTMQAAAAPMDPAVLAATKTPQPRVAKAAQEFEASLMKELLRPLQQQEGLFGGEKENDGSNDALSSFASDALAGAISSHGGFGIARRIVEHLGDAKAAT